MGLEVGGWGWLPGFQEASLASDVAEGFYQRYGLEYVEFMLDEHGL